MSNFNTYSLETVPEAGRETLETVNKAYGFVPNLIGTMVESPALANAYLDIGKTFGDASFTPTEQQVVLLTASRVNECDYCIAAHSTVAKLGDVPASVVNAIRENAVDAFIDAGFTRAQVLEVVLGVAMKTLSNYTNHIAKPALDPAFQAEEWRVPTE